MLYLVDLFCGAGGFSQGATQAGAKVVLAIDSWGLALDVHRQNHPTTKHVNMILGQEVSSQLEEIIGDVLGPQFDHTQDHLHIHGSPPCQQLSTVNGCRNETEGLALTLWTLDFLMNFNVNSKWSRYTWTIEQVYNKKIANIAIERGATAQLFNMMDHGVCQTRKRLVVSSMRLDILTVPRSTIYQIAIDLPTECARIAASGNWRTTDRSERAQHTRCCVSDVFPTITGKPHYMLDSEYRHIGLLSARHCAAAQTFNPHYFETAIANLTSRDHHKMIANSVPPAFSQKIIEFLSLGSF